MAMKIPTAFYRGYELGNGINDWIANPKGNSPAIPKNALWANRAVIQQVGSNLYWQIDVDAFRFGADASPAALHKWWDALIRNIFYTDPSMFSSLAAELAFVTSKNDDSYSVVGDLNSGDSVMTLSSTAGLVANDIMIIYDKNQASNRNSDVIQISSLPGAGVVNFTALRVGSSGLSANYLNANIQLYKVEAAWTGCYLLQAPDIGTAEEPSRGNFRKHIQYSFISNGDRYQSA